MVSKVLDSGRIVHDLGSLIDVIMCGHDVSGLYALDGEETSRCNDLVLVDEGYSEPVEAHKWLVDVGDLREKIVDKMIERGLTGDEYISRVEEEIGYLSEDDMDFLYAVSSAVERMREEGVEVGFGRGSSCASLILFVLGVHMVDPIKYGIPVSDFYKDM